MELGRFGDAWRLVTRISVGLMFANSGWGKIAAPDRFRADFEAWSVPFPSLAAPATAWAELILGVLLIAGLLTRVAAAGLALTMVGALWFSVAPAVAAKATTTFGFLGNFFYASEWLLILALAAIVLAGAGRLSVDAALRRRQ
ncbi:DoxX family protein [Nocardia brasiliensis]|uniref:DoxX family protein n=1 Tax=Nocardia brasiliensis TaxID=37326 RepID=UPI0002E267F9|nr:DoxX family protein [Nocardia brasiliensis]ASF08239.1 DoxX family protein [Nocardia brasiliensis]SUB41314.1 DoxX [Nocardia brasiliensis]